MTATERLWALLDERGVERKFEESAIDHVTTWNAANGGHAEFYESKTTNPDLLQVNYYDLTPEQAVEATLGRGTCHAIVSDNLTESEGTGDAWADCSECGHLLFVLTDPSSKPPHYCPNCGRRVVSE